MRGKALHIALSGWAWMVISAGVVVADNAARIEGPPPALPVDEADAQREAVAVPSDEEVDTKHEKRTGYQGIALMVAVPNMKQFPAVAMRVNDLRLEVPVARAQFFKQRQSDSRPSPFTIIGWNVTVTQVSNNSKGRPEIEVNVSPKLSSTLGVAFWDISYVETWEFVEGRLRFKSGKQSQRSTGFLLID